MSDLTEKEINTIKDLFYNETILRDEEQLKKLAETTYSNPFFHRDLKQTVKELEGEYSEEMIEKVVKHYILSVITFMYKIHDYRVAISISGAFSINIPNNIFRPTSKYYYKRHQNVMPALVYRFNKIKRKLILKTKDYV